MDDLTFWLDDIGNVSSPQQWEKWFAWYPVKNTRHGKWYWMSFVYRRHPIVCTEMLFKILNHNKWEYGDELDVLRTSCE